MPVRFQLAPGQHGRIQLDHGAVVRAGRKQVAVVAQVDGAVRLDGLAQRDGRFQPVDEQDIRGIGAEDVRHAAHALRAVGQLLEVVDHALLARGGVVPAAAVDGDGHELVGARGIDALKRFKVPGQLANGLRVLEDQPVADELGGLPLVAHEQVHAGIELGRHLGHLAQPLLIDQLVQIGVIGIKSAERTDTQGDHDDHRQPYADFL